MPGKLNLLTQAVCNHAEVEYGGIYRCIPGQGRREDFNSSVSQSSLYVTTELGVVLALAVMPTVAVVSAQMASAARSASALARALSAEYQLENFQVSTHGYSSESAGKRDAF